MMRFFSAVTVMWIVGLGLGWKLLAPTDVLLDDHKNSIYYVMNEGKGGGTGFATKTAMGFTVVVTNAHVCRGAVDGNLKLHQDDMFVDVPTKIVLADEEHDICILKAPHDAQPIELADGEAKLGERIYVAGHPNLTPFLVTSGVVEGRIIADIMEGSADGCPSIPNFRVVDTLFGALCIGHFNAIESNAPSKPGSSGSPVLNKDGKIVGVLFAGGESDSLILPLENLKAVLDLY